MAIRGRDFYLSRVKKWLEAYPQAVDDAVHAEALNIQRLSQEQCPVQYGRLKNSANTTSIGVAKYRISYGTNYAIYVHERVDLNHPVGKAKFLEDPINDAKPTWVYNLWRRTSANLKKAGV